jgi:hypothetical protein
VLNNGTAVKAFVHLPPLRHVIKPVLHRRGHDHGHDGDDDHDRD